MNKEKEQEVLYGTSYKRQCGLESVREVWV